MNQFEHVQLLAHKGLKGAILENLEKINVICGPNNSGKTTVLECLENQKLRWRGKKFHGNTVKKLGRSSGEHGGWGGIDSYTQAYIQIVEGAFGGKDLWFDGEADDLWARIEKSWKQRRLENYNRPQGQFKAAFKAEYGEEVKTVLIPAKRRLETSKRVDAFDRIWAGGDGILNFLFNAKNQDESSEKRKQFDVISTAFLEISAGFEFNVYIWEKDPTTQPPQTNVELKFRKKGGSWIQANDCGLGLQELLIILYFALASEHEVVLIEEPENHLHPEIQRRLIAFLREKTGKQFFLSTHSSVFLNTQFADRVFTCRMTDSVHVENATSRAVLLTELGYSIADNLVSDLVVLCEGPKDKPVLEEFFQKMGLLDRSNIKVWPLGGDIMDQLDLSVFQESHKLIALIDNDPGSATIRKRFLKKCEELKIPVTHLKRYSLENYFSLPVIESVVKNPIPSGVTALDPNKRVSDQLGFEVKGNGGKIAKDMKLEDIKGTDFEEFLQQVEKLATEGQKK